MIAIALCCAAAPTAAVLSRMATSMALHAASTSAALVPAALVRLAMLAAGGECATA